MGATKFQEKDHRRKSLEEKISEEKKQE